MYVYQRGVNDSMCFCFTGLTMHINFTHGIKFLEIHYGIMPVSISEVRACLFTTKLGQSTLIQSINVP